MLIYWNSPLDSESLLDVVGRVNIEITLDTFCTNHSFIVVQKLTVDCFC